MSRIPPWVVSCERQEEQSCTAAARGRRGARGRWNVAAPGRCLLKLLTDPRSTQEPLGVSSRPQRRRLCAVCERSEEKAKKVHGQFKK